jgi:hypothetical protein
MAMEKNLPGGASLRLPIGLGLLGRGGRGDRGPRLTPSRRRAWHSAA